MSTQDADNAFVLAEHGLENLDYIHEAAFKLGCKLHFDTWFLEGARVENELLANDEHDDYKD